MTAEINRLQLVFEELLIFLKTNDMPIKLADSSASVANFQLQAERLSDLKMACIMDEFTALSYGPECKIMQLSIDNWKSEIHDFSPHILFIESAWQGKDKGWYKKVSHGSQEIFDLAKYCKDKKIPIVYWGKEDPLWTQAFMPAASQADFIFTSDLDQISKYKAETGNPNVYHLHFAAQPTLHNPIEKYERSEKFCYAGTYYRNAPRRTQIFDTFAEYFIATNGLDIFDRNHKKTLPEYCYPDHYAPYIQGYLPPSEIERAYKGYFYGVNTNAITQSQTMFARRVFELMASNTIVIGNFAHGIKNYFGDLTISTDDVYTLKSALKKYCSNEVALRKYRLKALRLVLTEHLYEDRLSYIVEKVFNVNLKPTLPKIAVISHVDNEVEKIRIKDAYDRQNYANKALYFILGMDELPDNADYIAYFSPDDYYGANYLTDLALATRYLDSNDPNNSDHLSPRHIEGIGKSTYYDEAGLLVNEGNCYRNTPNLVARRGMIKLKTAKRFTLPQFVGSELLSGQFFSIDEFNYRHSYQESSCLLVDDIKGLDEGISLEEIVSTAEALPMPSIRGAALIISPKDTAKLFNRSANKNGLSAKLQNDTLYITASIDDESPKYLYFNDYYDLANLCTDNQLSCYFEAHTTDLMGMVIVFFDESKRTKVGSKFIPAGRSISFPMSDEILSKSKYFRIALRFKGVGQAIFTGIKLGQASIVSGSTLSLLRSDTMVLSSIYPSYDNLYRNMFVHARVKAYQRSGLNCVVMCSNIYGKDEYREFDGIHVLDGRAQMLVDVMSIGKIKTVCVHFLDEQMFTVLKTHLSKIRLIVWVHGSEIQPWWRREYNYTDNAERERAKEASEKRATLWNEVFESSNSHDIHFVFVSQYFADEVMEDYKIKLPTNRYTIIHNMIDTKTFNYVEKDIQQRKKIFSCRPYTSRKYANDLSVKAIIALSKHKEFSDMQFHVAGSGELFKETTAPLRRFKNVTLEERFYTHDELAAIHKEYGICLTPTRCDSQGVSRDEAMSSGLVPITSNVDAIPEFVDKNCGILAPAEDWKGLADGILRLYYDPELFKTLSHNAAVRVRSQSDTSLMVEKELSLMNFVKKVASKIKSSKELEINTKAYWENRYASGRNSGSGSYGCLAEFKAEVVNEFCRKHNIETVVEWGCGDGNQLSLMKYPNYLGLDVSDTIIELCKERFSEGVRDKSRNFRVINENLSLDKKYDLAISLDVIYHIVEDEIYQQYMSNLFSSSSKYVGIYSYNEEGPVVAGYMRFRKHSDHIEKHFPEWELYSHTPARYPYNPNDPNNTSYCEFFFYRIRESKET